MTGRLADINGRIGSIRQLGAVVNAMRGIAAARVQQAGAQLAAIDSYSETIADAIGQTIAMFPWDRADEYAPTHQGTAATATVLFCAEQGFAGAFSERVLDAISSEAGKPRLFLIGSRGILLAAERDVRALWTSAMPSATSGIPRLADKIANALYQRIALGEIGHLDVIFAGWLPGKGVNIIKRRLFPLELKLFQTVQRRWSPITNLRPDQLLDRLTSDYIHAQLCKAALHSFAAENQSRMEAMASTHTEIEHRLSNLEATYRQARQEEITAEIVELASGSASDDR